MLVTNLNYCDFYIWSNGKSDNDKFLVRIEKDTTLCETMTGKHAEVFDKVILLELLTQKSHPKIENKAKLHSLCCRPSFLLMIACDNKLCKIEWFHYSCVNVKIAPQGREGSSSKGGEVGRKTPKIQYSALCISHHIELNFDALEKCNYSMEINVDKLLKRDCKVS